MSVEEKITLTVLNTDILVTKTRSEWKELGLNYLANAKTDFTTDKFACVSYSPSWQMLLNNQDKLEDAMVNNNNFKLYELVQFLQKDFDLTKVNVTNEINMLRFFSRVKRQNNNIINDVVKLNFDVKKVIKEIHRLILLVDDNSNHTIAEYEFYQELLEHPKFIANVLTEYETDKNMLKNMLIDLGPVNLGPIQDKINSFRDELKTHMIISGGYALWLHDKKMYPDFHDQVDVDVFLDNIIDNELLNRTDDKTLTYVPRHTNHNFHVKYFDILDGEDLLDKCETPSADRFVQYGNVITMFSMDKIHPIQFIKKYNHPLLSVYCFDMSALKLCIMYQDGWRMKCFPTFWLSMRTKLLSCKQIVFNPYRVEKWSNRTGFTLRYPFWCQPGAKPYFKINTTIDQGINTCFEDNFPLATVITNNANILDKTLTECTPTHKEYINNIKLLWWNQQVHEGITICGLSHAVKYVFKYSFRNINEFVHMCSLIHMGCISNNGSTRNNRLNMLTKKEYNSYKYDNALEHKDLVQYIDKQIAKHNIKDMEMCDLTNCKTLTIGTMKKQFVNFRKLADFVQAIQTNYTNMSADITVNICNYTNSIILKILHMTIDK